MSSSTSPTAAGRSAPVAPLPPSQAKGEGSEEPTERAVRNVMARNSLPRWKAENLIGLLHRGNLVCLDCGSENHTRGHAFCASLDEGDNHG